MGNCQNMRPRKQLDCWDSLEGKLRMTMQRKAKHFLHLAYDNLDLYQSILFISLRGTENYLRVKQLSAYPSKQMTKRSFTLRSRLMAFHNLHIILCFEMANFLGLLVEVLPLTFLFLIYLLLLGILKGKFKCFHLCFFRFLHILWIIRQNFVILWNFKLVQIFKSNFLMLLIFVLHWPQPQKLDYFLNIILFIAYMVPFFINFLDNARIKLSVLRIYSLAMCTLLKQRWVWQLKNLQIKSREIFRLCMPIPQYFSSLFLYVYLQHLSIFPLSILFQKTFGQIFLVRSSQQLLTQCVQIMLFFQIFQSSLFLFQCYLYFLFNLSKLLLFLLLSLREIKHKVDFHFIFLELYYGCVVFLNGFFNFFRNFYLLFFLHYSYILIIIRQNMVFININEFS